MRTIIVVSACILILGSIGAPGASAHIGVNGGTDSTDCSDDGDAHVHINTSHGIFNFDDMVCFSLPIGGT